MDSRQVWFLGSGGTADLLAYRPGERLTAADGQIVRDAMFGIDRATGERIRVRMERNPGARIAAAPYHTVLIEACEQAGIDPRDLSTPAATSPAQLRVPHRGRGTAARRDGGDPAPRRGSCGPTRHAWDHLPRTPSRPAGLPSDRRSGSTAAR